MSEQVQSSFTCPKCETEWKASVYTSVDVTLEPKLRQQVVDKKLNRVACTKCDFNTLHASPFLYQDHQRDFMIQLASDEQFKQSEADAALEEIEGETQEQIITRRVRSYEELIEKLYILEAGLDDRVVEVLKLQIREQEPELKGAPIAFNASKKEGLEFFVVTEKGIGRFHIPTDSYNGLKAGLVDLGLTPNESKWAVVDLEFTQALLDRLDPPTTQTA